MNLSRIDQEVSTAESSCVGTTTHATPTFQCRDISISSFKNTSKKCPKNSNIARVHASAESIRGQSTSPNPSRYLPKIIRQRIKGNSTKGNSTCCWEHFVLRADSQHHGPGGPQFYCKQANARHNKHDGKGQTNVGLPRDTSECDHTVLSIGHGFERPFTSRRQSSWDGPPRTGTRSNYMGHFLHCVPSFDLLWLWRPRSNLALSSSIAKKE